jgi:membrane carboxypeptidase/penicillin-binding protein
MPAGIEQVAINPRTGAPASEDDPEKRMELFINGTSPSGDSVLTPDLEASPELEELPSPEFEYVPAPLPDISPTPTPRRPLPRTDTGRLEGTITLDIDPSTGLIAVETCPVVRTRTFVLGTEPTRYCGPEYHRPSAVPQATRPRSANPPR